jgi:DNA-binding winged helix-turn-helix (wHTH) protein
MGGLPRRLQGLCKEGVVSLERTETKREGPIRFGLFELDGGRGQLRRSGVPVDLPPQALKVLAILAEHPDELVTRKEIKEVLWPGESYGDFDSRLNFAVRKLREALGDDAEQPRYVQTVRNAGYRFIAPVREARPVPSVISDSSNYSRHDIEVIPAAPVHGMPATAGGSRLGRSGIFLVLMAVAFLAVATAAVLALRPRGPAQLAVSEVQGTAAVTRAELQPEINSVTAIVPQARQRIVIRGRGFGLHVAYVHTDSPHLAIRDVSAHWAAGRIVPHNSDKVMVDVESWSDAEIVISGFRGDYGLDGWKLTVGDEVEVAVWNPQSGVGPGLYHLRVIAGISAP